jgi:glucose/arabinose dehydrogenase
MKANLAVSATSFVFGFLLLANCRTTHAQNLFAANFNNNTVEEFDSSGVGTVFAKAESPPALAFDSSGNLYVANLGSEEPDTIEEFSSSGGILSSNGTVFAAGLSGPNGLAFDSAGNLYVADYGNRTIVEFNTNGVGTVVASSGLNDPSGLAFDGSGNLYAANIVTSTIEEFSSSGGVLSSNGTVFASSGLSGPQGLAFDKNGNLYVANYANDTIEEFSPSGGVLSSNGTVFASSGVNHPTGLAFDSAGNLYVANTGNNTIEEFNSSGVGTVFASGLDNPRSLAFQPVPEPSTWALLAMGSVALLVNLQRRRRSL